MTQKNRVAPADNKNCLTGLIVSAAALYIVLTYSLFPKTHRDLSDLIDLEQRISNLESTSPIVSEPDKLNAVIGLNGQPPSANYMFSIAITKTSRDAAITDILLDNKNIDYSHYGYFISSASPASSDLAKCQIKRAGTLAILSAQCMSESERARNICDGTKNFSTAGIISKDSLSGLSGAEQNGRWMEGDEASFECEMGDSPARYVTVNLNAFVSPNHPSQRLQIFANEKELVSGVLTEKNSTQAFRLPIPVLKPGDKLKLRFVTPDAVSPSTLGMNSDPRPLSFFTQGLTFE